MMVERHIKIAVGAVLLACAVLCGSSCTVKEDRTPCPSYLRLTFADREFLMERGEPVTASLWTSAERYRDAIDTSQMEPYWERAVVKDEYLLSCYTGLENAVASGRTLVLKDGNQMDSLYAFHQEVDCTGELAEAEVTLHKQFATVFVDLMKGADQMKMFTFTVQGFWNGFDMADFSPVGGPFWCKPEAASRLVSFRIPRQGDDSLLLDITFQGERIGQFPLGSYIKRTGYNWKSEDLQDIYIMIDIMLGQILVSVDGWESGEWFRFIEQ